MKSFYFYWEGSVRIPFTPVKLFVAGEGFPTVLIGGPVFECGGRYGHLTVELVFLTLTAGWNAERYPV